MVDTTASDVFLSARDVSKVYRVGERTLEVLSGVTLGIGRGELLSIRGASGAGKSTLMHILGALDTPTAGIVTFDGQVVNDLRDRPKARLRNRAFGFVFQFFHLLPDFSAIENVVMPRTIGRPREPRPAALAKGEEMLAHVGLGDRTRHRPNQLSGGERQRVAIARALANEPDVLLCDEPTGNLDSRSSAEVLEVIFRLNREFGLTVVIVTHDEGIAKQTPRVVGIADGKVVSDERQTGG